MTKDHTNGADATISCTNWTRHEDLMIVIYYTNMYSRSSVGLDLKQMDLVETAVGLSLDHTST